MTIAFIDHVFYYTAVFNLLSRLAPYIPIAKARGFTALFGKTSITKFQLLASVLNAPVCRPGCVCLINQFRIPESPSKENIYGHENWALERQEGSIS